MTVQMEWPAEVIARLRAQAEARGLTLDEFVLQAVETSTAVTASDAIPTEELSARYKRLREEMAASGIPMLGDEELRREIRERRGVRPEHEV